jgi:hypothetical protein
MMELTGFSFSTNACCLIPIASFDACSLNSIFFRGRIFLSFVIQFDVYFAIGRYFCGGLLGCRDAQVDQMGEEGSCDWQDGAGDIFIVLAAAMIFLF